jgi:hypothetical protein
MWLAYTGIWLLVIENAIRSLSLQAGAVTRETNTDLDDNVPEPRVRKPWSEPSGCSPCSAMTNVR